MHSQWTRFLDGPVLYSLFLPLVFPDKTLCQTIHLLSGQINSPRLHWHTKKHLLYCIFSISLTNNYSNLTESYNQGMKVHFTTKDVKKNRLCIKFSPLFLVSPFRIICQYPRPGSTWVKLSMTQHLKVPLNYLKDKSYSTLLGENFRIYSV